MPSNVVLPSLHRAPSHRHAAPCGPWPWMNLDDEVHPSSLGPTKEPYICPHEPGHCVGCWDKYPQSLFPNWTPSQVSRSRMKTIVTKSDRCVIHRVEVTNDGKFHDPGSHSAKQDEEFWKILQESRRAPNVRVRALFVENISVPVLQMLGTKYEVEPFFWTSSVNWIPSRYQEDFHMKKGDHITITLSFPRAMERDPTTRYPPFSPIRGNSVFHNTQLPPPLEEVIDTQRPLPLRSSNPSADQYAIILDHLAIHMLRGADTSTIISYQPTSHRHGTTASNLHTRVFLAGQSVYWGKLFKASNDPTFVLLTILWYALYAWDQALEMLWEHICELELDILNLQNIEFTQELHRIRAHLLHYASLLDDFHKSVEFVHDTPNPVMQDDPNQKDSKELLDRECRNLLIQIERLSDSRVFWDERLQNIMHLAFSSVNIEDSNQMKKLTQAAVRDSAAMRQLSYLTMVFLPASFVASAFGMNVQEINPGTAGTLGQYVALAIPLTLVTMWLIVAMQGRWEAYDEQGNVVPKPMWVRLSWPAMYVRGLMKSKAKKEQKNVGDRLPQWGAGRTNNG